MFNEIRVEPTIDKPVLIAFLDFCLQSDAIEFCDLQSLVILPVDCEVFGQVAGLCKMQSILVAKFAGWFEHAVMIKKRLDRRMVGVL